MKNFQYILSLAILISGCGEHFSSNESAGSDFAGEAGQIENPSSAGSSSFGGNVNEAGDSNANQSGSGGLINSAGMSGTTNDGGMANGGMTNGGNSSGGLAGANNGGSNFSGAAGIAGMNDGGAGGNACKPLTCEDFKRNIDAYYTTYPNKVDNHSVGTYSNKSEKYNICGSISDGCGKQIDCGGCANPYEQCNVVSATYNKQSFYFSQNLMDQSHPKFNALPAPSVNVCVGGCAYMPNKVCPIDTSVGNKYVGYKVFTCLNAPNDYLNNLPEPSCEEANETIYYTTNATFKAHIFCCKPTN